MWRGIACLQEVNNARPGACTVRFQRYTEHVFNTPGAQRCTVKPFLTLHTQRARQEAKLQPAAGLAHLESIDEEAVVYVRAASEAGEAQLTPEILAQSLGVVRAYGGQVIAVMTHARLFLQHQPACTCLLLHHNPRIHVSLHGSAATWNSLHWPQAGVFSTILMLSARADAAPVIIRTQLAAGDIARVHPSSNFSVACRSTVQVRALSCCEVHADMGPMRRPTTCLLYDNGKSLGVVVIKLARAIAAQN